MADARITYAVTPHSRSPYERITHVGNSAAQWIWPREQVIASIEAKTNTFYVLDPVKGRRIGGWYAKPARRSFLGDALRSKFQ